MASLCTVLAVGCSVPPSGSFARPTSTARPATVSTTVPPATTTTPVPTTAPPTTPPTTPPAPPSEQPGWTVVSQTPAAIVTDERTLVESDGSRVTVARFRVGTVRVDLHVGSTDPPTNGAAIPPDSGSAVSVTERPSLLAAFNGGFKTSSGSGGFEVAGQVLKPLLPGLASVVTDANGSPSVGVWGHDVPKPGVQAVSVRQNLRPLVEGGVPSATIDSVSTWGATLGGGSSVARGGLGEDAAGDLLYAGSISALPVDVADALVTAGATTAMELDINPNWVQLDLAGTPGGALTAAVPGQNRPADQYLAGWSRDFLTVLAKGPSTGNGVR